MALSIAIWHFDLQITDKKANDENLSIISLNYDLAK